MRHWHFHPRVPSENERSIGEVAADRLRLGMGSWTFFIGFMVVLVCWMATGGFGWDRSPFFHLNLILSMIAGLQGSALLIADKRADRIQAEITRYHLELTTEIHDLLGEVHALNLKADGDA
jgi:uncharacterized membrane protein